MIETKRFDRFIGYIIVSFNNNCVGEDTWVH